MRSVIWMIALAGAALLCSSAHAEDARLQALIDQRGKQLSADSEKLEQLRDEASESRTLEARLENVSPEQQQQIGQLEQQQDAFNQKARELAGDAREIQESGTPPTKAQIDDLVARSFELSREFDALTDAAEQADAAGVPGASTTTISDNLNSQLSVNAATGLAFLVSPSGTVSDGNETLGTTDERLDKFADRLDNLAANVSPVSIFFSQDAFDRRAQLKATEAARDAEIEAIERRAGQDGSGGAVLAALTDRLANSTADRSDRPLTGDVSAGERVQELAEGLAGAGQRIAEIDNEIDRLEAGIGINDEISNNLADRLAEIDDLLSSAEELQADIDEFREANAGLRDRLANAGQDGFSEQDIRNGEQVLQGSEERLAALEAARDKVLAGTANRDDLKDERDRVQDLLQQSFDESNDQRDQRQALQAERDAIAGLQGELADLIRNGAPLGDTDQIAADPANPDEDDKNDAKISASINLDRFLEGGGDTLTPGALEVAQDGALPDAVQEAAGTDPLGLDQFGFDADQGATENILNGQNNIALIPCPPGSNALPVGTLVSNTAVCFL